MTAKGIVVAFLTTGLILLPQAAWAAPAVCPAVEDPTAIGGVTRAARFDLIVQVDLPISTYYCGANAANPLNPSGEKPTKPSIDQMEGDPCAASGKTVEQNKAECLADPNTRSPACACVYWLQSGANCPVNRDGSAENNQSRDQMKRKIVEAVKQKLSEKQIGASQNTNTNLKTEADTIHEGTLTKLRTPTQAENNTFVNETTGETAKAKGENKVYYAGCFNLDFSDLGLPPETGWFTMVKNSPPLSGIVPPSFKKEAALMTNLQNGVSQLPGTDPVIKALQDQEPIFSNDAAAQADFPKINLSLAAKRQDGSKNKYLVYWKLCTARGATSCDISNFIADLEDVKTKQTVVATTPSSDWGQNTSDPSTSNYQCFMTGDFNTGPLEVNSDVYGSYFSVRAKIVGQASDEVQKVPNPHCQNSAEVTATVALNSNNNNISYGSGNYATVAYCPENDYEAPFGDSSSLKSPLGALANWVRLETITRLFNVAKDRIFNVFEKHVTVDSPPQQRQTCEALENLLCGENKVTPQGTKLSVTHTVTPSRITPDAGNTAVPISVEIKVVNNSSEDATNVDVVSIWNRGSEVANIKRDDGTEVPGRQVSWHIDQIPGNNTSDNVTTLTYTATVRATAQEIYRLQTLVYGDVTSPKDVVAKHKNVPLVVGTATPSTPVIQDASGLKVRQTLDPITASTSTSMQLVEVGVWVSNDSGKTITGATLRSVFDQADKVSVNNDGGDGSEIITGGMQWNLADLLPNAEDTLTFSAYVDASTNQLYKTSAELAGTMITTTREEASYENAAITVGKPTSLCKTIAWIVCYFTNIQNRLTSKTYTKDVVIHTYPYPNVAYTGALQTDATNGRDGYYNLFAPPQDEYGSQHAEQELTNIDTSGGSYPSKTLVMGANEVKLDQTKVMRDYLSPPGQPQPSEIATSSNDEVGAAVCPTTSPITPPSGDLNKAFTLAACNNLSIPARSSYTETILEQAAAAEGVPVNLLAAILFAEYRSAYTATGPSATCNPNVCAAYGWFQITCGAENVTCAEQNPASHCSDFYCCDTNDNGIPDSVCEEYRSWFNCPTGATSADLCDPAKAAVLAAQKLKAKIGVDRNHVWTASDACRAGAKYFGAVGNCDLAGGSYASLGNCTYGRYVREFVTQAGL